MSTTQRFLTFGACLLGTCAGVAAIASPVSMVGAGRIMAMQAGPFGISCAVDPAIGAITLRKGSAPGQIRVEVQVSNQGAKAWQSWTNSQRLIIRLRNVKTGALTGITTSLPVSAPANGSMGTYTTPFYNSPFDTGLAAGTVDVRIEYNFGMTADNQPCNDDKNMGNNNRTITQQMVQAFLAAPDPSRTF